MNDSTHATTRPDCARTGAPVARALRQAILTATYAPHPHVIRSAPRRGRDFIGDAIESEPLQLASTVACLRVVFVNTHGGNITQLRKPRAPEHSFPKEDAVKVEE